ncbi:MAG: ABC transporter ATP-binding protein, partial [Spirochaetia bacterium]
GPDGPLYPVRDVSLSVAPGELHAIVGESGSGKSLTCRSVLRLGPPRMRVASGSVQVEDVDVTSLSGDRLRRFRGARVGMIFQEPAAHLSPSIRAGAQIAETLRVHDRCSHRAAKAKAHELAERVGLTPAKRVLRRYPHELSGGMAQRVAIASAIICGPSLLIADEPTTALDATVQQSVLSLIDELRRDMKLGVLLVSHDLAVVERYADTVTVLYAGKVVEQASSDELFRRPRHPYTQALLRARPQLEDLDEARVDHRRDDGHTPDAVVEPLVIPGAPPTLRDIPSGCPFHPRCPAAVDLCRAVEPQLLRFSSSAYAACHVAADRVGLSPDDSSKTDPRAQSPPEVRE